MPPRWFCSLSLNQRKIKMKRKSWQCALHEMVKKAGVFERIAHWIAHLAPLKEPVQLLEKKFETSWDFGIKSADFSHYPWSILQLKKCTIWKIFMIIWLVILTKKNLCLCSKIQAIAIYVISSYIQKVWLI